MTYVEGFLTAVPVAHRETYREHAARAADLVIDLGASRMVEAWGEDIPDGQHTDMRRAVRATPDETVVFSWFEYPDKATRDAANARLAGDPRMDEMMKDMPFDGRRMIYSGFAVVSDLGDAAGAGFIDGVVLPVTGGADAYTRHAVSLAPLFREYGAVRVVDTIGDDIRAGEVTDFPRAVDAAPGEAIGFGWIVWPARDQRDAAWERIMGDERMTAAGAPPWDGKRMIFGGFTVLLDRRG